MKPENHSTTPFVPFEYEHQFTPEFIFSENTTEFIETLYPAIYYRIYPRVCYYYDMLKENYGLYYYPNKLQFSELVAAIYEEILDFSDYADHFGSFNGYNDHHDHYCTYLKDLVTVLMIRKLTKD